MRLRLCEVIAARRDLVITTWVALVKGSIAPEAMSMIELVDHIPTFLDEIIALLQAAAGDVAPLDAADCATSARGHGENRLRLGFSLDSVVREYGALREAIVTTALQAGGQPTFAELHCVFNAIIDGIARAVSEYARQRDAEQLRLHNEHIAFIAHELRNPLSSASTAHEILKAQGHLPAGAKPSMVLERGLASMQDVIDNALAVAQVVSGIELRREHVALSELLAEAELVASGEADVREVTLDVRTEQDAVLDVDRRLMRSALHNIVRNAVKYTARATSVEIRSRVDAGHVVIEVEDSCGGLPPGKIESAFAPFVRLTKREPGFGLGLAIAKQAMDAHAGSIRVQNLPGKGCIFVLELPIQGAQS